ncbi:hypothetical protein JW756_06130 [Candidatus Woesearchaeota archaeon]|nr:hypothetical protein [Candidatus Woesearchaeota archaeon]
MGFFDRIDKAIHEEENYQKAKAIVERALSLNYFTLDTNILITLAMHGDNQLLGKLVTSKNYYFTSVNRTELERFVEFGKKYDYDSRTIALIKSFLEAAAKYKRMTNIQFSQVQQKFAKLLDLIPRKLVFDVMIAGEGSLVKRLIQRYESIQQRLDRFQQYPKQADIDLAEREYQKDVANLKRDLEERYIELCNNLKVDDFKINEKLYFHYVENFKKDILNNIYRIQRKYSKNFADLIMHLRMLAQKKFDADLNYISDSIVRKAVPHSMDSDVTALIMLDAARIP